MNRLHVSSLEAWLVIATRNLCDEAKTRITDEVTRHYEDAVAAHASDNEETAQYDSLEALGDPKTANREFLRNNFTWDEATNLARIRNGAERITPLREALAWLAVGMFLVVVPLLSASDSRHAPWMICATFVTIGAYTIVQKRVLSPIARRYGLRAAFTVRACTVVIMSVACGAVILFELTRLSARPLTMYASSGENAPIAYGMIAWFTVFFAAAAYYHIRPMWRKLSRSPDPLTRQ